MRLRKVHFLRLAVSLLFILTISLARAQVVWQFKIIVGVEKRTAEFYQTASAKLLKTIVQEQFVKVNANFNRDKKFNGTYNFKVDSVYVIQDSVRADFTKLHPGFDYKIIVDGFDSSPNGGGWYEINSLIYQKWKNTEFGGPFEQYATDGLTRDLARARGAVDLYALQVEATKNPINGKAFNTVSSIMNFPYNDVVWDQYTVNLLNKTAGNALVGKTYVTASFPTTLHILTKDSLGNNAKDVKVEVFPVEWYSNTVTATALVNTTTNATGIYTFAINPFAPNSASFPYSIRYANFLVKASKGTTSLYQWIPLYDAQNKFFKDGGTTPYSLDFIFPAEPASIKLNALSDSVFCPSERFVAEFAPSGSYAQGNYFKLQLSNANGSFGTPITLGDSLNKAPFQIAATIPGTLVEGSGYRIRIVSTNPRASSNELKVTLAPFPAAPVVTPLEICQNTTPPVLLATIQNLMWYKSDTAKVGSSTRPVVSTTLARDTIFYVSQSVLGCESPRSMLRVTVLPLATLSLSGTSSIYTGEETTIKLSFTGGGRYNYELTNNIKGIATKDTTLKVKPIQTTTYRVVSISNACGIGKAGKSDSVRVQLLRPTITTRDFSPLGLCPGATIIVRYRVNGRFAAGTSYSLQIARVPTDSTAAKFIELGSVTSSDSLISVAIPDTTLPGSYYVRVAGKNSTITILGSDTPTLLNIISPPSAAIVAAERIIFGGETTPITINFTGAGPWNFSYREVNDNSLGTIYTATALSSPYDLIVRPLKTTIYFLTSVSNACGSGPTSTQSVMVKVIPLLSAANPTIENSVEVYPLPTTNNLTIRVGEYASPQPIRWELHNVLGQVVMQSKTYDKVSELSLTNQPAGLYLLRIQLGEQVIVKKIIKQ